MSENAAPEPTNQDSPNIPPQNSASSGQPRKSHKHLRLIILFTLIILIVVVIIIWILLSNSGSKEPVSNPKTHKLSNQQKAINANAIAYNGDYAKAQKILDDAVANVKSPEKKIYYLNHAYANALNAKKYKDALKYATEEYSILPSSDSAFAVGQAAKFNNKLSMAREYFKKSITLLDKSRPGAQLILEDYKAALEEVDK